MQTLDRSTSLASTLRVRRRRLAESVDFPVILWSGKRLSRNFPANTYPFRASSHFLYFAGLPLENAVIRLESGKLQLFMDDAHPDDILWHGKPVVRDTVALQMGANSAYPLSELHAWGGGAATIASQDPDVRLWQGSVLHRAIMSASAPYDRDWWLTRAIVNLRLTHDEAAVSEIRRAVAVSIEAHKAGMAATRHAQTEAQVRAAMEGAILSRSMTCAYPSIVTTHGEVLHNDRYHNTLQPGDLLLADVGAEAETGWASDVTRTWPVSGKFSPTQRAIYDVVLAAHDACIAEIRPDVEFWDIHMLGAKVLTEGLIDLGIFKGETEELMEMDAHTLFFPHGIGHLLGLDVHDMEDFGDLAGYAEGRWRSDRFGVNYLRLNRPLEAWMAVTIEPGFYQVPALLNDPERRAKYQKVVDWERLEEFSDVRGIRIEDDVLVTEIGPEVLTTELPTKAEAIEHWVQG